MMTFFVPHTDSPVEAEKAFRSMAHYVGTKMPAADKRIFRLSFTHGGHRCVAEVGQPLDSHYREGNQPVLAIFEDDPYRICLARRGREQNTPVLVAVREVLGVVYFDAAETTTQARI